MSYFYYAKVYDESDIIAVYKFSDPSSAWSQPIEDDEVMYEISQAEYDMYVANPKATQWDSVNKEIIEKQYVESGNPLDEAKTRRTRVMWSDEKAYLRTRGYGRMERIYFLEIWELAKEDYLSDSGNAQRLSDIQDVFEFLQVVMDYRLDKEEEIAGKTSVSDVEAVTWDFTTLNSSDPGISISDVAYRSS